MINKLFNIEDRVVIVTGASGQIGSQIVNACVLAGARVLAVDLDIQQLNTIQDKYDWSKDCVQLSECDIRSPEQIEAMLNRANDVFNSIDYLVNNAGVSVFEPWQERPSESIDFVMDVNLKGTMMCIQKFAKNRISKGGGGAIVNIASLYGLVSPDPRIYTDCDRKNSEIYGATKAGIIQITRYFAVHLAEHNIRTNCIAPGGVLNPDNPQGEDFQRNYGYRCPMGRMADTDEIVWPTLFLLTDAASYINGQTLAVDGGFSAW